MRRRGCYPRAYLDEQIYWTIVGVDGDTEEGMLSEDGALEVRKGSFSVEPFIRTRSGWLHVGRRDDRRIRSPTATCRFRASSGSIGRSS